MTFLKSADIFLTKSCRWIIDSIILNSIVFAFFEDKINHITYITSGSQGYHSLLWYWLADCYKVVVVEIYNPGKKWLTHFVWFRRKRNPFPQRIVDPSHVSEALPHPQHWFDGAGKDYSKKGTSALCCTMSCPIFYFNGKHGDSCNKLHQVCQQFFSRIVAPKHLLSKSAILQPIWS